MQLRSVDLERSLSVSEALRILWDVTHQLGFELELTSTANSPSTQAGCTRATLRTGSGTVIGQAAGKGIGDQALASGGYEAYEHAAWGQRLPGQSRSVVESVLPPSAFERVDRLYAYARHVRGGRSQPVLQLHRAYSARRLTSPQTTPYPRVAVDRAMVLDSGDADLAVLGRYATSSGYAAGNTVNDAVVHAVNELVERDAISAHLASSVTAPTPATIIDVDASVPLYGLMQEVQQRNGVPVTVAQLPAVAGTVILAYQAPSRTYLPSVGVGCSADPRIAFERAVTELQQEVVANDAGVTWADEGGISLANLDRRPRLRRAALTPAPLAGQHQSYEALLQSNQSPPTTDLIPDLNRKGFATLWRTVWAYATSDAEMHVVQVVVPGLERFASIVFGRPLLPAGRIWSPELTRTLMQERQDV